jgi:NTP pyrophosphatase (non-canonical NTP hydrolase)
MPRGRIHEAMTIEEITARICAFRDARDWQQFHNPTDMAVAIAAEAGELMQHFVWKTPEQIPQVVQDKRAELTDEIADVAILLFELAHNLDIPLTEAMQAKLDRNEKRYPADKARGNNLKYNELGA